MKEKCNRLMYPQWAAAVQLSDPVYKPEGITFHQIIPSAGP